MAQIWRSDAPFDTYAGLGPADRPFAGPPRPPSRSNSRGSNAHHEAAVTWSAEEDAKLEELVRLHTHAQTLKPVWATIAEAMGRTGASCRNHYLRMRTGFVRKRSGSASRCSSRGPEAEEEPPPKSAKIANDELLVAHELSALFHSEPSPMTAAAPRHRAGAPTPFSLDVPGVAREVTAATVAADADDGSPLTVPIDAGSSPLTRSVESDGDAAAAAIAAAAAPAAAPAAAAPSAASVLVVKPIVEDDGACSDFEDDGGGDASPAPSGSGLDLLLGACSTAPRAPEMDLHADEVLHEDEVRGAALALLRPRSLAPSRAAQAEAEAARLRSLSRALVRGGGAALARLHPIAARSSPAPRSELPESDAPQYGDGVRPQVLDSATYAIFARAPAEAAGDAAFDEACARAAAEPTTPPPRRAPTPKPPAVPLHAEVRQKLLADGYAEGCRPQVANDQGDAEA